MGKNLRQQLADAHHASRDLKNQIHELKTQQQPLLARIQQLENLAHELKDDNLKLIGSTRVPEPIPMLLWCPQCNTRHIDDDNPDDQPHSTHACQGCGMLWKPALVATRGVKFLPGCLNNDKQLSLESHWEVAGKSVAAVSAYVTKLDTAVRGNVGHGG